MESLMSDSAGEDNLSAQKSFIEAAVAKADCELLKALLKKGVKIRDTFQAIECLHTAAEDGDAELLTLLLQNGAAPYVNDVIPRVKDTALHLATRGGHTEVVKILLDNDADVYALSSTRRCTYLGNLEFFVDENVRALHIAAEEGHYNIAKALLESNSEVDALTEHGYTPLHLAVIENHTDVVRLLLRRRALICLLTKDGESVIDIAKRRDVIHILTIIEEHMAFILTESDYDEEDIAFARKYITAEPKKKKKKKKKSASGSKKKKPSESVVTEDVYVTSETTYEVVRGQERTGKLASSPKDPKVKLNENAIEHSSRHMVNTQEQENMTDSKVIEDVHITTDTTYHVVMEQETFENSSPMDSKFRSNANSVQVPLRDQDVYVTTETTYEVVRGQVHTHKSSPQDSEMRSNVKRSPRDLVKLPEKDDGSDSKESEGVLHTTETTYEVVRGQEEIGEMELSPQDYKSRSYANAIQEPSRESPKMQKHDVMTDIENTAAEDQHTSKSLPTAETTEIGVQTDSVSGGLVLISVTERTEETRIKPAHSPHVQEHVTKDEPSISKTDGRGSDINDNQKPTGRHVDNETGRVSGHELNIKTSPILARETYNQDSSEPSFKEAAPEVKRVIKKTTGTYIEREKGKVSGYEPHIKTSPVMTKETYHKDQGFSEPSSKEVAREVKGQKEERPIIDVSVESPKKRSAGTSAYEPSSPFSSPKSGNDRRFNTYTTYQTYMQESTQEILDWNRNLDDSPPEEQRDEDLYNLNSDGTSHDGVGHARSTLNDANRVEPNEGDKTEGLQPELEETFQSRHEQMPLLLDSDESDEREESDEEEYLSNQAMQAAISLLQKKYEYDSGEDSSASQNEDENKGQSGFQTGDITLRKVVLVQHDDIYRDQDEEDHTDKLVTEEEQDQLNLDLEGSDEAEEEESGEESEDGSEGQVVMVQDEDIQREPGGDDVTDVQSTEKNVIYREEHVNRNLEDPDELENEESDDESEEDGIEGQEYESQKVAVVEPEDIYREQGGEDNTEVLITEENVITRKEHVQVNQNLEDPHEPEVEKSDDESEEDSSEGQEDEPQRMVMLQDENIHREQDEDEYTDVLVTEEYVINRREHGQHLEGSNEPEKEESDESEDDSEEEEEASQKIMVTIGPIIEKHRREPGTVLHTVDSQNVPDEDPSRNQHMRSANSPTINDFTNTEFPMNTKPRNTGTGKPKRPPLPKSPVIRSKPDWTKKDIQDEISNFEFIDESPIGLTDRIIPPEVFRAQEEEYMKSVGFGTDHFTDDEYAQYYYHHVTKYVIKGSESDSQEDSDSGDEDETNQATLKSGPQLTMPQKPQHRQQDPDHKIKHQEIPTLQWEIENKKRSKNKMRKLGRPNEAQRSEEQKLPAGIIKVDVPLQIKKSAGEVPDAKTTPNLSTGEHHFSSAGGKKVEDAVSYLNQKYDYDSGKDSSVEIPDYGLTDGKTKKPLSTFEIVPTYQNSTDLPEKYIPSMKIHSKEPLNLETHSNKFEAKPASAIQQNKEPQNQTPSESPKKESTRKKKEKKPTQDGQEHEAVVRSKSGKKLRKKIKNRDKATKKEGKDDSAPGQIPETDKIGGKVPDERTNSADVDKVSKITLNSSPTLGSESEKTLDTGRPTKNVSSEGRLVEDRQHKIIAKGIPKQGEGTTVTGQSPRLQTPTDTALKGDKTKLKDIRKSKPSSEDDPDTAILRKTPPHQPTLVQRASDKQAFDGVTPDTAQDSDDQLQRILNQPYMKISRKDVDPVHDASEEDIMDAVVGTDQSQIVEKIDSIILASLTNVQDKYKTKSSSDQPQKEDQSDIGQMEDTSKPSADVSVSPPGRSPVTEQEVPKIKGIKGRPAVGSVPESGTHIQIGNQGRNEPADSPQLRKDIHTHSDRPTLVSPGSPQMRSTDVQQIIRKPPMPSRSSPKVQEKSPVAQRDIRPSSSPSSLQRRAIPLPPERTGTAHNTEAPPKSPKSPSQRQSLIRVTNLDDLMNFNTTNETPSDDALAGSISPGAKTSTVSITFIEKTPLRKGSSTETSRRRILDDEVTFIKVGPKGTSTPFNMSNSDLVHGQNPKDNSYSSQPENPQHYDQIPAVPTVEVPPAPSIQESPSKKKKVKSKGKKKLKKKKDKGDENADPNQDQNADTDMNAYDDSILAGQGENVVYSVRSQDHQPQTSMDQTESPQVSPRGITATSTPEHENDAMQNRPATVKDHASHAPEITPRGSSTKGAASIYMNDNYGTPYAGRTISISATGPNEEDQRHSRETVPGRQDSSAPGEFVSEPGMGQFDTPRPSIKIMPSMSKRRKMGDNEGEKGKENDTEDHRPSNLQFVSTEKGPEITKPSHSGFVLTPAPQQPTRWRNIGKRDDSFTGPREAAKKARPTSVPDVYVLAEFNSGSLSNLGVVTKDESVASSRSEANFLESSVDEPSLYDPYSMRTKSMDELDVRSPMPQGREDLPRSLSGGALHEPDPFAAQWGATQNQRDKSKHKMVVMPDSFYSQSPVTRSAQVYRGGDDSTDSVRTRSSGNGVQFHGQKQIAFYHTKDYVGTPGSLQTMIAPAERRFPRSLSVPGYSYQMPQSQRDGSLPVPKPRSKKKSKGSSPKDTNTQQPPDSTKQQQQGGKKKARPKTVHSYHAIDALFKNVSPPRIAFPVRGQSKAMHNEKSPNHRPQQPMQIPQEPQVSQPRTQGSSKNRGVPIEYIKPPDYRQVQLARQQQWEQHQGHQQYQGQPHYQGQPQYQGQHQYQGQQQYPQQGQYQAVPNQEQQQPRHRSSHPQPRYRQQSASEHIAVNPQYRPLVLPNEQKKRRSDPTGLRGRLRQAAPPEDDETEIW